MNSTINQELSSIFKEMSNLYKYMGPTERFRALSYQKAANVLASLPNEINEYVKNNTLEDLPGIGESIGKKIREFINTGVIQKHKELKKDIPRELLEIIEIKGFGPQTIKKIHTTLNITSKKQLVDALQCGTIETLKGFGKKKTATLLESLKLHEQTQKRLLLNDALAIGEILVKELKKIPEIQNIELAGSLRRRKETIGDIDILISANDRDRKKIIDEFIKSDMIKKIMVKGNTKASVILKQKEKQADIRIVNDAQWGAALLYFTGSKEHNIHLRSVAKEKNMKLSEYGLFDQASNIKIAGETEASIYKALGLQNIPPEMRENNGEIELACEQKIPILITLKDIKGDLQMHSSWSDGMQSIEKLAEFVKQHYNYEYIAITDHSQSSRIANGITEKQILNQIIEIKAINKKLDEEFIKTGIEVDILANGNLDISDEIMAQLDWVTASIHSGFKRDNTDRILKACENPYVSCIGHPTGRLIGERNPYNLNFKSVIEMAASTQTALEINAQPQRMDLKDDHVFLAREKGVKLVISTDSHSEQQLGFMTLGVDLARRAWCKSSDILNTMKWKEIEKWLKAKQYKLKSEMA